MGAGIRRHNRGWLLSYLSPAPSPSKSTVAVQSWAAPLGGYREHQVLRHLCLYSTWVSHAEKALQEPSPEVLVLMLYWEMCLCPMTQLLCSWRLLIYFLVEMQKCQPWNRNIQFLVVSVPTSVAAPGFTALLGPQRGLEISWHIGNKLPTQLWVVSLETMQVQTYPEVRLERQIHLGNR